MFAFGFAVVGWWWRLLAFGVRPAFVRRHGGPWRLFAFGFAVVGWSLVVAFARLWCEASVCPQAWWWLAFVRLWFWCGWLVVGILSLLVSGQRLFAGVDVAGVCSPLVLAWLVGGGVCLPVVPLCLLARYVVCVCLLWFSSCCRSFGGLSRLRLPWSFSVCPSICFFGGIRGCLLVKHRDLKKFVI